jgi:hypothetical protein
MPGGTRLAVVDETATGSIPARMRRTAGVIGDGHFGVIADNTPTSL